jgi:endonuclease/exonuclease/phosphatase family metal-dependent hydrolase
LSSGCSHTQESSIKLVNDLFSDSKALAISHSGYERTYHGFDLTKISLALIDHIFITKDITVGPYRVVDEGLQTGEFGSEHLPVIADIKLP